MYYLAFPEDRLLNKILVYGVYFLETVQAILLLYKGIAIYNVYNFILRYGLPEPDGIALWTAVPLLGGIGMFSKMDIIQLSDSLYQQSCLHRPIILRISASYPHTLMGNRNPHCLRKILFPLLRS
jgi:hypothetical protein